MSSGPEETEQERLTRNWDELLQELRVSQTGVQILFAFLLGVAFTDKFADTSPTQRVLYFISLLATAAAVGLLIAPVAFHRILFRQRARIELVRAGNRFAIAGLVCIAVAIVSAVGLATDFILHEPWALVIGIGSSAWFLCWWLALPLLRRRAQAPSRAEPGAPRPDAEA